MSAPLPEPLRNQPFTPAMASVWGLSRYQVYSLNLDAPVRGVRSAAEVETVAQRCAAISLVVECHAFSHLTAARLHGLPLPMSLDDDESIHVMRDARDGAVRRRGIVGHRGLFERAEVCLGRLPVTDLADTWVDIGELIAPGFPLGLDDLVVMGDAIANILGSVDPLWTTVERRVSPRGKLTLLEALKWVRVGSESPGETRTRLVLVRAGLPEPELNQPLVGPEGRWLGRPDMRWTEQRVLLEYQGREFHDSDEQRAQDGLRFKRFEDHGWSVEEAWNDDVNSDAARVALVLRVADALGHTRSSLHLGDTHPRFFSKRMLELAEIRARRLRAQAP